MGVVRPDPRIPTPESYKLSRNFFLGLKIESFTVNHQTIHIKNESFDH